MKSVLLDSEPSSNPEILMDGDEVPFNQILSLYG